MPEYEHTYAEAKVRYETDPTSPTDQACQSIADEIKALAETLAQLQARLRPYSTDRGEVPHEELTVAREQHGEHVERLHGYADEIGALRRRLLVLQHGLDL